MEENLDKVHRDKIYVQIREAYGRVTYTYTSYLKRMNRLDHYIKWIKVVQITLSAITTVGVLSVLITNQRWQAIISGVASALLLAINLYTKDFRLVEDSKQCRLASDELWIIRENYISLLTDFDVLTTDAIVKRRDEMQSKVYEIYSTYPKTDRKSYRKAQNSLKNEEEQLFTIEEIDEMLPQHLRMSEGD